MLATRPKPVSATNTKKLTDLDEHLDIKREINVFVRIRPLVGLEVRNSHAKLDINVKASKNSEEILIPSYNARKQWKGFTRVFEPDQTNRSVYNSLSSLVKYVSDGGVGCCFCYGHTGSGKTHTVFGYGDEYGMYRLAAQELSSLLPDNTFHIEIRFAEIYNGKVFDLLDKRKECYVREDSDGKIHIRGNAERDASGYFRVKKLHGFHGQSEADIVQIVENGLKTRKTGSSGVHDQSSRSHALLEMEIVHDKLIELRNHLEDKYAEMMHLGKVMENLRMKSISLVETGYSSPFKLRKAFEQAEKEHKEAEILMEQEKQKLPSIVGGTLVFLDLAVMIKVT
jgi:hypothetical protein